MKPLRGEHKRKVVHDPWQFDEQQIGHRDVAHVLSDDGAIESTEVERAFALGCGCLGKTPSGICSVCVRPVCSDCFGFCERDGCGRPLCRHHSLFVETSNGVTARHCQRCAESTRRKLLAKSVVRSLLSPFIRFED